jgi:hypothetical protein
MEINHISDHGEKSRNHFSWLNARKSRNQVNTYEIVKRIKMQQSDANRQWTKRENGNGESGETSKPLLSWKRGCSSSLLHPFPERP